MYHHILYFKINTNLMKHFNKINIIFNLIKKITRKLFGEFLNQNLFNI